MQIEIKIPSVGESIKEAVLAEWHKKDGEFVQKNDVLFVLETDKVTLEVEAEESGILKIKVPEGESIAIGAVAGFIDTEAEQADKIPDPDKSEQTAAASTKVLQSGDKLKSDKIKSDDSKSAEIFAPSVQQLIEEKNIDPKQIIGSGPGKRISKNDVLLYLESKEITTEALSQKKEKMVKEPLDEELIIRKPMTPIRRRIASHLLEARLSTAMLTTFNEIDMSGVMDLRAKYKELFKKRYGLSLGIMSFFIKASIEALKACSEMNAFVDENDILYHDYYHIGVAVGSDRGLVVPVIRHADQFGFADLELKIIDFINKIKENRLELKELEGGTFTISNGGVYGSLLSTPILNTPQSGILGMHKIEKRPVVINDEIVIRPMMYVALSYDHRVVDGKEAVTFLKRIKECVENPERLMLEI